ncbi:enoyl-CoA hydratase/isomerase family protein [Nocardioides lentus]|uniref:Enoyl-CoA hydratase/isomerase family protein n=1 Tax=Nocardioides lentus TaxID=338077 RepID=A0ABP5AKG3_9ACTN
MSVRVDRDGAVVRVLFDRPERHNAFTTQMYADLADLVGELRDDTTARVVVLRGAGGRAFAAGNEIRDFAGPDADPTAHEAGIRALLRGLLELPQVTVAAIEGVCVGGGLAVATHCDLRVATTGSRFGYPIARTLGNVLPAAVLYRCAAVFGESVTRQMLLASRLVDAERAHAVGALLDVVDPAGLDAAVDDLVAGVLAASPATLRATKEQLLARVDTLEGPPADDERRLAEVYGGDDFAEGVRAFLANEKPRFGTAGYR